MDYLRKTGTALNEKGMIAEITNAVQLDQQDNLLVIGDSQWYSANTDPVIFLKQAKNNR